MPSGKKRKRHKMSTHKRKKRLRKNTRRRSNFYRVASAFLGKILVMLLLTLSIKQFLFSERFNS